MIIFVLNYKHDFMKTFRFALTLVICILLSAPMHSQSQFNYIEREYVDPVDLNLMQRTYTSLQARYESNYMSIDNKVDELIDVVTYIKKVNGGFTKEESETIDYLQNEIDDLYENFDFLDFKATRKIVSNFNSWIREIKSWKKNDTDLLK